MDKHTSKLTGGGRILALIVLTMTMAHFAPAAEVFLRADVTTKTLPGGPVVCWGFAQDSAFGAEDGQVTVPGPRLVVPPGDNQLIVHMDNNLTAAAVGALATPVSIMIPGQPTTMTATRWVGGPYDGRLRSFTHETPPGNAAPVDYVWDNVQPGTYVYHSATHLQLQVPMGLYGAMTKDFALMEAYDGVAYDNQALLLYSEIDPDLNAAVAAGQYGPGTSMTSTIDYQPQYFLVNGEPFSGDPANPGAMAILDHPLRVDEQLLIRFLNAGVNHHTPTLRGLYMDLVAEDGNTYPYPRRQYSTLLGAGSTVDGVLTVPEVGVYPIYDRMLWLANAPGAPGGLYAFLEAFPDNVPITMNDAYATDEETTLTVAAPGVLANDVDAGTTPLSAVLVTDVTTGDLTLNADGSLTYVPPLDFFGVATFTYVADDGLTSGNLATVTITVNPIDDPPVALPDAYDAQDGTTLTVTATSGVLANDVDVDGDPLTAVLVSDVTTGDLTLNPDGSFTYLSPANFAGPTTFTYMANDGTTDSNVTTVTITVADVNHPPVAMPDTYAATEETTLTVTATSGVLVNDTDIDGDPLTAVLVNDVTTGDLTLNPDGSFIYVPPMNFAGDATFNYAADDGLTSGNVTTATITVGNVNDPPVALPDVYAAQDNTTLTVTVTSGVLANDTDPDGDPLTAVLVTPGTGTVTLNPDGSFTYFPTGNFHGVDMFTYAAVDTSNASDTAVVTIDVAVPDLDMDGKPDSCETTDTALLSAGGSVMTNLFLPDSDADGLLDGQEDPGACGLITTATLALTNPRDTDSDTDGFSDGMEVLILGTNPLDPNDPNPADPNFFDVDGDGLPAGIDPDDNNPDFDADGYPDGYEVVYGTDPTLNTDFPRLGDVNGDGVTNNVDVLMLFNYSLGNIPAPANMENSDIRVDAVFNNVDVLVLFNWTLGNVTEIPLYP